MLQKVCDVCSVCIPVNLAIDAYRCKEHLQCASAGAACAHDDVCEDLHKWSTANGTGEWGPTTYSGWQELRRDTHDLLKKKI
jgi:hypothetical protein